MPQSYFTPEPFPSAFVVIAFLGMGLALAALVLGAILAFALRRRTLSSRLSIAGATIAAAYMAVLVSISLASRERVLRKGDRKYFCEIDCHMAYSLEDATRANVADRTVLTATIRSWFDERTIASWRGNAPLTPNPKTVFVVDGFGRRYDPSRRERAGASSAPMTRVLRPGESYTTMFVFDLPATANGVRLFLGDPPGPEWFLIGHENSFFHKKIYFAL